MAKKSYFYSTVPIRSHTPNWWRHWLLRIILHIEDRFILKERIHVRNIEYSYFYQGFYISFCRSQIRYGEIECYGNNTEGESDKPCLFEIVPPGMYTLYSFNKKFRSFKQKMYSQINSSDMHLLLTIEYLLLFFLSKIQFSCIHVIKKMFQLSKHLLSSIAKIINFEKK
jgi:hypothetical protein